MEWLLEADVESFGTAAREKGITRGREEEGILLVGLRFVSLEEKRLWGERARVEGKS